MKYANLIWQNTEIHNSNTIALNIGDNLQFLAIENIYNYCGINLEEVVLLKIEDIKRYRGEKLVLPLNWALFDKNLMQDNNLCISKDIKPIFLAMTLGINFREEYMNEYNIRYLRDNAPIGCRDQECFNLMQKYNIPAYVNGCMTAALPKKEENNGKNILLIDAPLGIEKYMPREYLKNTKIYTQQYYIDKKIFEDYGELKKFVVNQYNKYMSEAALVITSRLHVALPCRAMGIPVILVRKYMDGRFEWIDKLLPIYIEGEYEKIDWKPTNIEYEDIKVKMLENAKLRIMENENTSMCSELDLIYRKRYISKVETQREALTGLNSKIINYLNSNFKVNKPINYILWGLGVGVEKMYQFISTEYPNAKLKMIVDKYREGYFNGISIKKPEDLLDVDEETYVFVLTVGAARESEKVLSKTRIAREKRFIVADQFVSEQVLKGENKIV